MTTRTHASRSGGRAPSTTWIARMPPAEPTTATTWTVGGSVLGAIRSRKEAADRLRLPASLLRDGLESLTATAGTSVADSLGEPLAESRALLQEGDRRPQRGRDRLSLAVHGAVCVCDLGAHLSTAILAHADLVRKAANDLCDCGGEFDDRQHTIRPVFHDRVDGQGWEERVVRSLNEDAAAAMAHRCRSGDAVV